MTVLRPNTSTDARKWSMPGQHTAAEEMNVYEVNREARDQDLNVEEFFTTPARAARGHRDDRRHPPKGSANYYSFAARDVLSYQDLPRTCIIPVMLVYLPLLLFDNDRVIA